MFLSQSELAYDRRIYRAILFFASENGCKSLPNKDADLLFPLIAAIVEHFGGDTRALPQSTFCDDWWIKIRDAIKVALPRGRDENLSDDLSATLERLTDVDWNHYYGETSWTAGLELHSTKGRLVFGETFCLTHPEVLRIQEDIRSNITPADLEHCKQIGLLMRKHILAAQAAK